MRREPDREPRGAAHPALHVAALTALAVSQPLLDLIGRNPEFLVAHQFEPLEVALLLVVLGGLLPAAAGAATAALARAHRVLPSLVVGALAALILSRISRVAGLGGWAAPLACYLGLVCGIAHARKAAVRAAAAAALPALVLVPAAFLLSPAAALLRPPPPPPPRAVAPPPIDRSSPSIAFVVLDEINLASLLDASGQIDAARFPNLAAFAQQSTWFRNATTISQDTPAAVRALLGGRRGSDSGGTRDFGGPALFDLLPGYAVHVFEQARWIDVCPPEHLPPPRPEERTYSGRSLVITVDLAVLLAHAVLPQRIADAYLPPLGPTWRDFARLARSPSDRRGRVAMMREFLANLPPEGRPSFYYAHMLLPHRPWDYLPSGRRYTAALPRPPHRPARRPGALTRWGDERMVLEYAQRYLLQLGAADRLAGEVFAHLQRVGRWDDMLVVVVGDHGIAFTPRERTRGATPANALEIAPIPLLIKLPGQRAGAVSDRNAESIDVLPTIADALGLEIPWTIEGSSLLDEGAPERPNKRIRRADGVELELPGATFEAVLEQQRAWVRRVGEGPLEDLPLFSPYRGALAGRPLGELVVADSGRYTLTLHDEHELAAHDPTAQVIPALVLGRVDGLAEPADLVVVVNGVVAAFARTLPDDPCEFEALLPERALRAGRNTVEVLIVSGPPEAPRLERARPR